MKHSSPDDLRIAWVERIGPLLDRLGDVDVPGVDLDFSVASIERLTRAITDRALAPEVVPEPASVFAQNADPRAASSHPVLESSTAYVGEVLLRLAGGRWTWDTATGTPQLEVPESGGGAGASRWVSAYELLIMTLTGQRSGALTDEADRLAATAERLRQQTPGWAPVKEHTPTVDPVEPSQPTGELEAWLAQRAAAFPAWVRATGTADEVWNFGLDSLDALEALLRDRIGSLEALEAAASDDLVQGAAWYFGEVLRRAAGGVWQYVPLDPAAGDWQHSHANPFAGHPYLDGIGDEENSEVPYRIIRTFIRRGTPSGLLIERARELTGTWAENG